VGLNGETDLREAKMKNLVKSLVLAGALGTANVASADWFDCFCPVIGVDYYQAWMKATALFGNVFPKSYPGGTVYVGAKFADCLGFEVGYDTSTRKSRSFTLVQSTGVTTGTVKFRRSGAHFDLIGYMSVDCLDCVELFGSLGYGWVEPRVTFTTLAGPTFAFNGRGRSVLRLGVGGNYLLTDCVGIRAKVGYESTSSLRTNSTTPNFGFSNKPFRGSITLALGAFVRF